MTPERPTWKTKLLSRVQDADRLVVWDYQRRADARRPVRVDLLEISDRKDIEDLLARIEIDEASSTNRCVSSGSPRFDFLAGGKVLASLGLHQGSCLRWERLWPADAELTRGSAFDVCRWLRDHGISEPWLYIQRQLSRSLAWQRRAKALRGILPEAFAERFLRVSDEQEAVALFRESSAEPATLARWCLEILGCDHSSWEAFDRLTHANEMATLVMPALGRRACSEALRRAVLEDVDRDACYGAARVLFFFGGWENFEPDALNEVLPELIRVAMRHPRRRNRQYVMWVLSQIEGGDEPLRWVLEGRSLPEQITAEESIEPEHLVFVRSLAPQEPLEATDRAYAAWLLGGMGVAEVRETIQDLARRATGEDATVFKKALEALGG